MDPEIGAILSNLTQALTAIGVILTAISSMANRHKLNTIETKAAANTEVIVAKTNEVKAQLAEVREAAVAVNAEVIDRIKNGGKAEAG